MLVCFKYWNLQEDEQQISEIADMISDEVELLLNDPDFKIKLVCVGSPNSGKTSLAVRFAKCEFDMNKSYEHSTETSIQLAKIDVNDKQVTTEIWDCISDLGVSHEEKRKLQYLNAMAFIVCVSLTDDSTMEDALHYWIPEIKKYSTDTPIILCGSKLDLVKNDASVGLQTHNRFSSYELMVHQAKRNKCKTYVETTCISDVTVVQLFATAIQCALGLYKDDESSKKCTIQ